MELLYDMTWQDLVFAGGQFFFIFALVPAVLSRTKPPLSTSVVTGGVLYVFAATYATMDFWLSATSAAVVASLWAVIAVQTYRTTRRGASVPTAR